MEKASPRWTKSSISENESIPIKDYVYICPNTNWQSPNSTMISTLVGRTVKYFSYNHVETFSG